MVSNHDLYNDDELNAPEWLNKEFFEQLLKNNEAGQDVEVKDFTITPGTAKSDHYASVMFRAAVNYSLTADQKPKHQSMMIKTMPVEEGIKMDLMAEGQFFQTEIRMYTETLPKIEAALREIGDNTKLCAKPLYQSLEPRKCIIFDDLAPKGYSTISNRVCKIEEVKAALLKLAKLHAVSYKLAQEGDTSVTAYKHGSMNSIDLYSFEATRDAVKVFKALLAHHDDLKQFLPHFKNIENGILSKCKSFFDAYSNGQREGINVLNHGDFHMKNMMITTNDDKLKDLMLVDYQICCFGSAALDVLYGFIMLFSPEMRRNNRDELFYYYFSNFQETLRRLGYTGRIPTMVDFQAELQRHRHWELFMIMSFLPLSYTFFTPGGSLSSAVEDASYRQKLFENPDFIDELRILLPRYLHKGYFEN